MAIVAGVDGCKGGWLCISLNIKNNEITPAVYETIKSLLDQKLDQKTVPSIIAVDIPIGLPEGRGGRNCDKETRNYLNDHERKIYRSCTVFTPPARQALKATSFRKACRINVKHAGINISKQAFGILSKINELVL